MPLIQINQDFENYRLDKLLCEKFDISFALAQKLIREKKVKVNGFKPDYSQRVTAGDQIEIFSNLAVRHHHQDKKPLVSANKIEQFSKKIFNDPLFEDENLLVIDKPSGIACQGGTGIEICIDDVLKTKKFQLLHRLDKDTSGVLLIAKNNATAEKITESFRNKTIEKTYLALTYGVFKKETGTINIPLLKKNFGKNDKIMPDFNDGKPAITNYQVLKTFEDFTLVKLMPITGRTHQLRVHCKEIGYPIINDVKYGGIKVMRKELSSRLCLHSYQIKINDYSQPLVITTKLPDFLTKFNKFIR